ncbi:MAG: AraC family transcriptional regulator [Pedosphaera sp.]|nr:AraC family transcriptional regulator [Pedosphaera sp.]
MPRLTPSAVPRLTLFRSNVSTALSPAMSDPVFCVLARGRKRIYLGHEEFRYDPNSYMVASLDLPVSGQVIEAPCLGMTLALDPAMLAALLLEMPPDSEARTVTKAVAVNPLEDDLLNPLLRLLQLLDQPGDIPMLAPLIEREILYRLLCGPRGEMLRQLALPSSQLSQISRAINLIRQRYDQAIRVDELARTAGMSPTSFHRHFRAVTAMSPLQFQKRIRLHEARRMLLSQKLDAASVSFDVGYESPSQFSREYRRLFGASPRRDAAQATRVARL